MTIWGVLDSLKVTFSRCAWRFQGIFPNNEHAPFGQLKSRCTLVTPGSVGSCVRIVRGEVVDGWHHRRFVLRLQMLPSSGGIQFWDNFVNLKNM